MVSIRELLDVIDERDAKITELRDKLGNLSQTMTDAYLNFAVLLGCEIGRSHKIEPKNLDIRIMLDGKIVISSGELFRLEFDNYNKLLEYLLCMVRLVGIEDGSAVAHGVKDNATVFFDFDGCYGAGR